MPKKNVDNTRWAFLLIRPNSMSPPKGTAMAPRVPERNMVYIPNKATTVSYTHLTLPTKA